MLEEKDDPVVLARAALEDMWERVVQLKGRCWGPSKEDNPYKGSNITMAIGDELVSVCQGDDGRIRIHQFSKTDTTSLGAQVKEVFEQAGLLVEEDSPS